MTSSPGILLAVLAAAAAGTGPEGEERLEDIFARDLYPLLLRGGEAGCVGCHDPSTSSDLAFVGDARSDLLMLRSGGWLDPGRPDGLLDRLSAGDPKRRMPRGEEAVPWTEEEIGLLRRFMKRAHAPGDVDDESFPASLLAPYLGEPATAGADTQFLTFTQLKGKVAVLFGDDWVRGGRDRFQENIALFGGADFQTRFAESSSASSGYMAALQEMAADVSENAYHRQQGPFAPPFARLAREGRREEARDLLFDRILLRGPLPGERKSSLALLDRLAEEADVLRSRPSRLAFLLEAADPQTGWTASQVVDLPVIPSPLSVSQRWLDLEGEGRERARHDLEGTFLLRPGSPGQKLVIHALEAGGPISFAGCLIEHEEGLAVEWIAPDSPRIGLEGGWRSSGGAGYPSVEQAEEDGQSARIVVPLDPQREGPHRISIYSRPRNPAARHALAEIHHHGAPGEAAARSFGPERREGAVHFAFDNRDDTEPYLDFAPAFRFGPEDHAEIHNGGTRGKVAVGPLSFRRLADGRSFEVDTKEAEGYGQWSPFRAVSFNAYNARGTRVEDQNKRKGELSLRYFPRTREKEGWTPGDLLSLRLYFPGKRDHAPRTPLVVRASASSPILRLERPVRLPVGGVAAMDASESFTSQGSSLEFRWRQLAGTPVELSAEEPRQEFVVPRRDPAYEGWLALAQGLVRHPDFLFTRAPSLDRLEEGPGRRSLQLSRLALDLAGRPPTPRERERFAREGAWEEAVDHYLESQDFRDFYFHRIRLYLESQGSPAEDEPVRLWCHVAFNDRPFQEILTADYTVDPSWERTGRPAYHGRTGLLTTPGFIQGKPGLPHYNYAAQVSMLFLGYRYEVPAEIVEQREGVTALGTTDPASTCYSCHKILTPLAFQRSFWTDQGRYRRHDPYGLPVEASDQGLVGDYPFPGEGMEAFALQAARKERFVRTMINTHFSFLFGRDMRHLTDERALYRHLWERVRDDGYAIRSLIRAIAVHPLYRQGRMPPSAPPADAPTATP